MRAKVLPFVLVLFSLLVSCNMPAGVGVTPVTQPPANEPAALDPNAIATAVELTAIARVTEIAGSAVPAMPAATVTPTSTTAASVPVSGSCNPTVTAAVTANVRSGPDTAYDIVGSLTPGQTATIVGRNDAYTWWYIDYPGASGGHAWISGTVVTSACVPSVVQVVAAAPLPTAVVAEADTSSDSSDSNTGNNGLVVKPNPNIQLKLVQPDLVAAGMQVSPSPAKVGQTVSVQVKVKNTGTADANTFQVQWWATSSQVGCNWSVSLAMGASKNLDCTYVYDKANNGYPIKLVVDASSAVLESNESNNSKGGTLKVSLNLQINPELKPQLDPIIIPQP
ncbi:MAG TPA: CARDB domain-containing protein [Anaerolineales bacterium]|nr:CARDB domain-containing protein [Anaerolineales bacterium]